MVIAFRVDASLEIGGGHVLRCLALADGLRRRDVNVVFLCCEIKGHFMDLIKQRGYKVLVLRGNDVEETLSVLREFGEIDGLVVDHYGLGDSWEGKLRESVRFLAVIDDLADRQHDCDLLIDQNYYKDFKTRYDQLVSSDCRQLLGPAYVMLAPEFQAFRKKGNRHGRQAGCILVFFGSSDLTNETGKVLRALMRSKRGPFSIDVILGKNMPYKREVKDLTKDLRQTRVYDHVDHMAEKMFEADLFIGAGGVTTFERCCLGLPSIVITTAGNQVRPIADMHEEGLLYYIGENLHVEEDDIVRAIDAVLSNPDFLKEISTRPFDLVDGLGTERCVDAIFEEIAKKNFMQTI